VDSRPRWLNSRACSGAIFHLLTIYHATTIDIGHHLHTNVHHENEHASSSSNAKQDKRTNAKDRTANRSGFHVGHHRRARSTMGLHERLVAHVEITLSELPPPFFQQEDARVDVRQRRQGQRVVDRDVPPRDDDALSVDIAHRGTVGERRDQRRKDRQGNTAQLGQEAFRVLRRDVRGQAAGLFAESQHRHGVDGGSEAARGDEEAVSQSEYDDGPRARRSDHPSVGYFVGILLEDARDEGGVSHRDQRDELPEQYAGVNAREFDGAEVYHGHAHRCEIPQYRLPGDEISNVVNGPAGGTLDVDEEAGHAEYAQHRDDEGEQDGVGDEVSLVLRQRFYSQAGYQLEPSRGYAKDQQQRRRHQHPIANHTPRLELIHHPAPNLPHRRKPPGEQTDLHRQSSHVHQIPRVPPPHHHQLPRMHAQHLTRRADLHVMLLQYLSRPGVSLSESLDEMPQSAAKVAFAFVVSGEIELSTHPMASPVGIAASHPHVGTGRLVGFEASHRQFRVASREGTRDGVGAIAHLLLEGGVDRHGLEGEVGSTVGTPRGVVRRIGGLGRSIVVVVVRVILSQYSMEAGSAESRLACAAAHGMLHVLKTNGTLEFLHIHHTGRFAICLRRSSSTTIAITTIANIHTGLIGNGTRFQRRKYRIHIPHVHWCHWHSMMLLLLVLLPHVHWHHRYSMILLMLLMLLWMLLLLPGASGRIVGLLRLIRTCVVVSATVACGIAGVVVVVVVVAAVVGRVVVAHGGIPIE